jgi:predicted RNase H-like HicB family nuclease
MNDESREAFETIRNLIEATDKLNNSWMIMLDRVEYNINVRFGKFDGEDCFEAKVRELQHIAEYGDTAEEAFALAIDTIETTAEIFVGKGKEMPLPDTQDVDDTDVVDMSREAFERLIKNNPKHPHGILERDELYHGQYQHGAIQFAFEVYEASRAEVNELRAELEQAKELLSEACAIIIEESNAARKLQI